MDFDVQSLRASDVFDSPSVWTIFNDIAQPNLVFCLTRKRSHLEQRLRVLVLRSPYLGQGNE